MTVSEAIKAIQSDKIYDDKGFLNTLGYEALSALEDADVVEVVRCKDCKHVSIDNYADGNVPTYICTLEDMSEGSMWYCPNGEREEAES